MSEFVANVSNNIKWSKVDNETRKKYSIVVSNIVMYDSIITANIELREHYGVGNVLWKIIDDRKEVDIGLLDKFNEKYALFCSSLNNNLKRFRNAINESEEEIYEKN